jgi:hypothetical protein
MINDLGHWVLNEDLCKNLNEEEFPFGFIYEITNNINYKKYIGKKQILSKIKRKPLKGKKRNRIDYIQSDWKDYTGSSNDLNADIEKYGKENFTFKILKFCRSKWEMAYFECKIQMDNNVLLSEKYYNGIINIRLAKAPKNIAFEL